MKLRTENIFDKVKKKKGTRIFISLLLLFVAFGALISCNNTSDKNQTISSEVLPQVISEDKTTTIAPEPEVPEEVADPYVFEVDNLLETRMDKSQISDYYITNIGDPSNLYYIDENQVLWGCGYNQYGQLGQGTQSEEMNPTMVKIAENVVHVDFSQKGYTVYLTEDHKLYGMGTNATGALLENIPVSLSEAYINASLYIITSPKLLMEDVSYVSLGGNDVVVLKNDNTVWTWGERWYGGGSNQYDRYPVKLLENAKLITGGWFNHAALLNDGTLWTWGNNFTGNCGIKDAYFISEPQKVASDVKMVWTGRLTYNGKATNISEFGDTYEQMLENTIIEKADGSFWACGVNIGGKEKTLDYYYEVGDSYTIVCSSEFSPCVIKENAEKPSLAKSNDEEAFYNSEDYGTIEEKKKEYTVGNSDNASYYYKIEKFYFDDNFPPAINNTLQQIYDEYEKSYQNASSSYAGESMEDDSQTPYCYLRLRRIPYIGDDYISIYYNDITYMGGAHPYSKYVSITIDCETGKQVTASELLGKNDDEILREVSETMGLDVIGTWDDIGFYITDTTIVFFYRMPLFWDDVVWPRT